MTQGFRWQSGPNRMNVVGLRGFDPSQGKNNNAFNRWNDTIAFVWKDGAGHVHVHEFDATTDPGYKSYYDTPDANGDGSGDVAHLRPGQYEYREGTHHGLYGAGNPTINVPVDRDTNHDGRIENGERAASIQRSDVGYGINIHWGPGSDIGSVGIYSLGCQVVTLSYNAFRAQISPLLGMNHEVPYTLVEMSSVA